MCPLVRNDMLKTGTWQRLQGRGCVGCTEGGVCGCGFAPGERSHRNDQGYFYDWEKFSDVKELNEKLKVHLAWSNRKPMRTLGGKSPLELLQEKLATA